MKKEDIKNYMIVCNGFGEFLIIMPTEIDGEKWIARSFDIEGIGLYFSSEFDDNLNHEDMFSYSFFEAYEPLKVKDELNIKNVNILIKIQKPKLLWERKSNKVSFSL